MVVCVWVCVYVFVVFVFEQFDTSMWFSKPNSHIFYPQEMHQNVTYLDKLNMNWRLHKISVFCSDIIYPL